MADYDLGCLSSHEFELLIHDIYQKKLDFPLETFKSGRDKGIDIRGCFEGETTIIQCKHYFKSSASTLISHLKDEVEKVEKINPERYIVATSVELNPNDKLKIKHLFATFCKNESDIFGREDILNFLSINDDIVKKHPKLWFTSSSVLEVILNKAIYNHTDIDIENFTVFLPKMVITEEFQIVDEILKKENVCIISGEPGIGKSTHMKGMIIKYSANGYQPIIISGNIKDAFKLVDKNKKQIFYYDDFLGSTFYNEAVGAKEEKSIESFISAVRRYKGNIKFILTTREYVLNQAQQKSDIAEKFGEYKHIISLDDASKRIKAEILYNHLWHSNIGDQNIDKIIEDQNYLKIINHRNFNPRIIEYMTNSSEIDSNNYIDNFLSVLNNPQAIWKKVYENAISEYSRTILIILALLDENSSKNSVFEIFCHYYSGKKSVIELQTEYLKSLKELNGSLITSSIFGWTKEIVINYKNPSVEDFINTKIVENDLFFANLCDLTSNYKELVKIWDIFKNQNKVEQIDSYPNFMKNYFDACNRIGKKYIDKNDTKSLKQLTIHLISLSGQIKEEKYIKYTNSLLKILLTEIEEDKLDLDKFNPLLSILTENKIIFPLYWDGFVSAIKKHLLSKNFTYLSEYIQIVDFSNITGISFEKDELDKLTSKINQFIEGEIDIQIYEKIKEIEIYEYNLNMNCSDHNGSDISFLEEINEIFEKISYFFNLDSHDLLEEIDSKIIEYYDDSDYESDEDEYQMYKDGIFYEKMEEFEEELGIQHLFEGLLEKNLT